MSAPAKICSGCGAIVQRGDEAYPDNHWPECKGGEPVPITREAFTLALAAVRG